MRLFKSNRSQASLSSHESRPHNQRSPTQSPPLTSPSYPPPPHAVSNSYTDREPPNPQQPEQYQQQLQLQHQHQQQQHQQQQHQQEQQQRYARSDENQPQPTQPPTRSQSQRTSGRPTVNIVGPAPVVGSEVIHETQQQEYPPPPPPVTAPAPAPPVQSEQQPQQPQQPQQQQPEQKRSKRGLFGLHSSKDPQSSTQAVASRNVGRSISVRKKTPSTGYQYTEQPINRLSPVSDPEEENQNAVGIDSRVAQDPERQPQLVYPPPPAQQVPPQSSRERVTLHKVDTNTSANEQYYQQQQSEHNSPFSQASSHQSPQSNQSPQYQEVHQPSPQRQFQYRAFQPPPQNTSNTYLPYQPQPQPQQPDQISLGRSSPQLDPHRPRPASQQSFGPPSPLNPQFQQPFDQRQLNSQQSRQSLQALPPPPPYHQGTMARGDAPHGMRQQMPPQHLQGNEQSQLAPGQGQQRGQGPPQPQVPSPYEQPQDRHSGQPQGGNFKPPLATQSSGEQGRSTPPPSKRGEDLSSLDPGQLIQKHEELQTKYSKVKKYYFEKEAQVTQLQNTLAHQRLSMSRTSLDDNEYATRFNRLDGAINNLAFNIRKDWRAIPPWLQPVVNKDAHSVGTKEMTAVGRACITKWVVDEIFDRYFHPGLEPGLSSQLKIIEKNVRRSTAINSEEQKDDMLAKISNWRLTTLEGLAEMLVSNQAEDYKVQLTMNLNEKLNASLQMMLHDPPPPGLGQGVTGIVELAVGILRNIPMESRDVYVEYFMPGSLITDRYMKMEATLPPLANPGSSSDPALQLQPQQSPSDPADESSTKSADTASLTEGGSVGDLADRDESLAIAPTSNPSGGSGSLPPRGDSLPPGSGPPQQQQAQQQQQHQKHKEKKSLFGGLVNKKPTPNTETNTNGAPRGSINAGPGAAVALQKEREAKRLEDEMVEKAERERRIRFSAFVAVEVRGKGRGSENANVLCRAPCYAF